MIRMLCALLAISGYALEYPHPRIDPQVDEYHGTLVADPYRYLEDLASDETQKWIAAENALTTEYLEEIPEKNGIRERLEALCNYEKVRFFVKKGERYFLSVQQGLQNQPVLSILEGLDGEASVLLDPNALAEDGTIFLQMIQPSRKGEWLAYALSRSGSDWAEIRIRNVSTKEDLPETLHWIKFPEAAWLPDGSGFYYARFDEPREGEVYSACNQQHKVYFHALRTSQESDRLIFSSPEEGTWNASPRIDAEGKYLLITLTRGCAEEDAVFYQKLGSDSIEPLFADVDASYKYIGNRGEEFWFRTDRDAPLGKILAVDLEEKMERDLIPEAKEMLEDAVFVSGKLVLNYLKDAASSLSLYRTDGAFEKNIPLPSIGTAWLNPDSFSGDEIFLFFCSFLEPVSVYSYHTSSGQLRPLFQPSLPFSPRDFETKQFFYSSKDGTKIPLFLSYRKGCSFEKPKPVYLYGYGGFGITLEPFFSAQHLAWMEMGGVLAIANVRGGNEYGKTWHEAGMLEKKQNVFDDFISAAEWLISEGITTPSQLGIGGGSNGGLLVGACLNQRPDLFGAALPMVGVLDMLRYQYFTLGNGWVCEYGSSEDPEQFSFLYRYSPLHNVRPKAYPPTFILTADHDDRVVPLHSYKYAAALQRAQTGEHPILLRVDTSAGHGLGKPLSKQIEEAVEKLAFLVSFLF